MNEMSTSGVFLAFHRRVHREETGFTLIEVMIAMSVLVVVMSSVMYTAGIASKYAAIARQRETAMGFATKYYQEALALPFANIQKGLNPQVDTTFASDSNIITNATTCKANGAIAPCLKLPNSSTYESLVVKSGANGDPSVNSCSPQTPPLCSHVWTDSATLGTSGSATTYTTRVYVTKPYLPTCTACYRVALLSSWTSTIAGGTTTLVAYQSLMTNTSAGCATVTTASHPFAGPCPTYLFGQALIPQGTIKITGNTTGSTSINGIDLTSAVLLLPQDAATSQRSQVSTVQALATTTGLSLGLGTATPGTVGGKYLAGQADNDPTLPAITSATASISTTPDSTGSISAVQNSSTLGTTSAANCGSISLNALCLSKGAVDTTGSVNAAIAGGNPPCPAGTTGVPCGYATSLASSGSSCPGTMSACVVVHLYNGVTDLGTCTLVSVGAPPSASSAQVSQTVTPQPQTAKTTRSFGQVTFGCIPSLVSASGATGWNLTPAGYTSVGSTNTGFLAAIQSGYTQTLQAQAGVASPTTPATLSGTEWYYNPGTTTQTAGTLSGNLATSGTFNVAETSPPPLSLPFPILIDSEQMNVTARTQVASSTYAYTVTRAYNSTMAASHTSGATVTYLLVPYGYVTQGDTSANGTAMSPASVNFTANGCTYQESITGLTSPTGSVANTSSSGVVTNSAGTMTAPMTGNFKFKVTCGTTVIADLNIAVDLGKMQSTATYAPAASS